MRFRPRNALVGPQPVLSGFGGLVFARLLAFDDFTPSESVVVFFVLVIESAAAFPYFGAVHDGYCVADVRFEESEEKKGVAAKFRRKNDWTHLVRTKICRGFGLSPSFAFASLLAARALFSCARRLYPLFSAFDVLVLPLWPFPSISWLPLAVPSF